jgi:hypothetical protein
MVSVEKPKTKEKFGSREKIRKWKTGIRAPLEATGLVSDYGAKLRWKSQEANPTLSTFHQWQR